MLTVKDPIWRVINNAHTYMRLHRISRSVNNSHIYLARAERLEKLPSPHIHTVTPLRLPKTYWRHMLWAITGYGMGGGFFVSESGLVRTDILENRLNKYEKAQHTPYKDEW